MKTWKTTAETKPQTQLSMSFFQELAPSFNSSCIPVNYDKSEMPLLKRVPGEKRLAKPIWIQTDSRIYKESKIADTIPNTVL